MVQPAFAKPHTTEPRDISVRQAYAMIKHQSRRNPVLILDVRNQNEYNLGHLYNAVVIPLYELEDRLSELSAYLNDKIVVYCKAGSRSAQACQILAEHGFRVYNMLGWITAWMQADYPIFTSYHHVTVDEASNGRKVLLDIDPLLLYQTECTSCNQNQTCTIDSAASNVTITVLEEDENLKVFAERCYTMATEAKLLSTIVETQLTEYNKNILNSKAIIMDSWDTCFWECIQGMISWLWDSGIMAICAGICYWCIVPPHVQCVVCAACIGAPVSGCVGLCYFLCWLGVC